MARMSSDIFSETEISRKRIINAAFSFFRFLTCASNFQLGTMDTREKLGKKREYNRKKKREQRASMEGREKSRKADRDSRKKRKIEKLMEVEEMARSEEKYKILKRRCDELESELKECHERIAFLEQCLEEERDRDAALMADDGGNDDVAEIVDVDSGNEDIQPPARQENEAEIPQVIPPIVPAAAPANVDGGQMPLRENERYLEALQSEAKFTYMTRFSRQEFQDILAEVRQSIENTTFRGTERKERRAQQPMYSVEFGFFLLLFWLAHYPTLSMMRCIFNIHERTITKILKRTVIGAAKVLRSDIQWPSDQDFEDKITSFCFFQNTQFENTVCVVDGTEIRISRPSKEPLQRRTWSGKKKQNSLNVMFITLLDGEIIYFSPTRIGAHDQAHWNELQLRNRFAGKDYGIMGDGGFTFNRLDDAVLIRGYKPIKSPSTPAEKKFNKCLSQMRVVVENSIRRVKQWRVFQGVYRHWQLGQGQLPIDDVLAVVVSLSNRKIKQCPPRSADWMTPEWKEIFNDLMYDE